MYIVIYVTPLPDYLYKGLIVALSFDWSCITNVDNWTTSAKIYHPIYFWGKSWSSITCSRCCQWQFFLQYIQGSKLSYQEMYKTRFDSRHENEYKVLLKYYIVMQIVSCRAQHCMPDGYIYVSLIYHCIVYDVRHIE